MCIAAGKTCQRNLDGEAFAYDTNSFVACDANLTAPSDANLLVFFLVQVVQVLFNW